MALIVFRVRHMRHDGVGARLRDSRVRIRRIPREKAANISRSWGRGDTINQKLEYAGIIRGHRRLGFQMNIECAGCAGWLWANNVQYRRRYKYSEVFAKA